MIKQITSSLAMLSMVLVAAPVAFAGDITVSNNNSATVDNTVVVSSDTGGNDTRGARGARGGEGGNASNNGVNSGNTAGDGGRGGNGGAGGDITTGTAISTAIVSTEANTSETTIRDTGECGCEYNETLSISSREGSSLDASSTESDFELDGSFAAHDIDSTSESAASSSNSSSSAGPNTTSASSQASNSSSDTYSEEAVDASLSIDAHSESESLSASEHDNFDLDYTRTYVGNDDDIAVGNSNSADLSNTVIVAAETGDNDSRGARGARGEDGGNANGSGAGSSNAGGAGGAGGTGGDGGSVTTGPSDSLSEVTTVTGRTITRVVRN